MEGPQDRSGAILEEIGAARRDAMLQLALEHQEEGHYAEALDMYRQVVSEHLGTEEEAMARQRMLDLAHQFGEEGQPYRMLALYKSLEGLYAYERSDSVAAARRRRVRGILDEIHERDAQEAVEQAGREAIREGRDR